MQPRSILSLGNFFSSAHFFLIVYIVAPYVATFMPANTSGLVVSLGAVVTLSMFPFMARLVTRHTAQRLGIYFACIEFAILLLLATGPSAILAVLLLALAFATSPLIAYQLDLLLEASVLDESTTGRVRTLFLTAGNSALIITPLIIGFLLADGDHYGRVFLAAAISLLPFILLMLIKKLPAGHAPRTLRIRDAYLCIMADRDLRAVALGNAVLQFFYHLAPLYIPLYLHDVLLIPWSTLGWMFSIMLLPFVLLEYPAGLLADTLLGDKFILAVGFIITGLTFAAFGIVKFGTPIGIILTLIVLTRVGAALIEAMIESHFFRRVSAEDTNTVSVFRMMRPAGALVAPIVGTLLLSVSYGGLFAVSGFVILGAGVFAALSIENLRR
jgi:MFS family permease